MAAPAPTRPDAAAGTFDDLRVLDLSGTVASGHVVQVLADHGASVVVVEPPGGAPVRAAGSADVLLRGTERVDADPLGDGAGLVRALVERADVVIDHLRPADARTLGLRSGRPGPRIELHLSELGEGAGEPTGSLDDDVVLARLGGLDVFGAMAPRPGPAYVSVPFGSFSAAQLGLQGIVAALLDRERTGLGQEVATSLLHGVLAHDIWNVNLRTITERYPDAFRPAPHVQDGVPNSALVYRLLVGLSADGDWLQFSQTSRHLFEAFLRVLDLGGLIDHPDWEGLPIVEDRDRRVQLWDRMLRGVRATTTAGWQQVFDEHPDVWAEPFRRGAEVLDHPQLRHDGGVRVDARGRERLGPLLALRVPGEDPGPAEPLATAPTEALADPLAHWPARPDAPGDAGGAAPPDAAAVPGEAASAAPGGGAAPGASATPDGDAAPPGAGAPPLAGITVVDLGMFFAGPMASALLADLGARVVKVEPPAGDPLRGLASFPELGAIKASQGKESIAVDLSRPEGRAVVLDLVDRADVVIQSFRAGAAARLGLDADALLARNPSLVYVNAAGYGSDGPCGRRPAYAPTIAAAAGIAWELVGSTLPGEPGALDLDGLKATSVRLVTAANTSFAQCDGLAALTNATAALVGLRARARDGRGRVVDTSMLHIAAHVNGAAVLGGRSGTAGPDLLGPSPLRRLYPSADGWVLLAAEPDRAARLATLLDLPDGEADGLDPDLVAKRLAAHPTEHWARLLDEPGLRAVPVVEGPVEAVVLDDLGPAAGLLADVDHPMLGPHPRLAPLVAFGRSATVAAAGCEAGQHTDRLLAELGHDDAARARLRADGVVA